MLICSSFSGMQLKFTGLSESSLIASKIKIIDMKSFLTVLKFLLLFAISLWVPATIVLHFTFYNIFFLLSFYRWAFNDQLSGEKNFMLALKSQLKITFASLNSQKLALHGKSWMLLYRNQKFTQIVSQIHICIINFEQSGFEIFRSSLLVAKLGMFTNCIL